jgi:rare lipoprotein A
MIINGAGAPIGLRLEIAEAAQRLQTGRRMIRLQIVWFTTLLAMFMIFLSIAPRSIAGSSRAHNTSSKDQNVQPGETLTGKATLYPSALNGHKTATGERFHQNARTAASNRLPLGTGAKVTNLKNGRSTDVRVNDHGPKLGTHKIDLSKKAATDIGLTHKEGTVPVKIKITRTPEGSTIQSLSGSAK